MAFSNIADRNGESELAKKKARQADESLAQLLKIADFRRGSTDLNIQLYEDARAQLRNHEQPTIPAWSMWEKSCRLAEWSYLFSEWEDCLSWSRKAASASFDCLRLTVERPLPEDYAVDDDYAFAPYGLLVDDRAALRAQEWVPFFESGIHWALVGSHNAIRESLCELPLDQLPQDETVLDRFYRGIQELCSGRDAKAVFESVDAKGMLKHLSSSLLAVIQGDEAQYSSAFESALRTHLREGEMQPGSVPVPVFPKSCTIVWHLAEERGFYPALVSHLQAHLFVLQGQDGIGPNDRSSQIEKVMPIAEKPADLLGLVDHEFQSAISGYQVAESKFSAGERLEDMAWSMCSWSATVVSQSYLGGQYEHCKEWCRIHCDAVENHLMMDWQHLMPDDESYDPVALRYETGSWGLYLPEGLAWAAIGDYWDGVDSLMKFPDERMPAPEGGEGFRLYYLGLARWWKSPNDLSWTPETKARKGTSLLVEQIEAITEADESKFAKAMNKYLTSFLKRRTRGDYEFPFKAIFNWHLAKRAGMHPKVTAKNQPYLFEIPK